MKKALVVVLIVFVLGAVWYVGMKKGSGYVSPPEAVVVPTSEPSVPPAATSGAVKTFTVSGNEFAFSPDTLNVNKGDTVNITFTNTGKSPHNFVIAELNVRSKTILSGESDTVAFTVDKTGAFSYVCSVPTHEDKGMVGTLTVQ